MNLCNANFSSVFRAVGLVRQLSLSKMPTKAGIIIIGDEILKGQTKDTNSFHLCKILRSVGVDVKKTCVVGDDIAEIANEITEFSQRFDLVLTSGGIGPTHDDVTLEAVAKAFNEETIAHPQLLEICKTHFGNNRELTAAELKLATVPASSTLHFGFNESTGEKLKFPLISVNNVFIFPGIPVLLERTSTNLKHLFMSKDSFHSEEIYVDALETTIASVLTAVVQKFSNTGVTFGSYPEWTNNYYKVKIVVESTSSDLTKQAVENLKERLPNIVTNYIPDPLIYNGKDVYEIIKNSGEFESRVIKSMQVIEKAFDRYKPEEICIGFNGGKDCTALLHLYNAVLKHKHPQLTPQVLYIHDPDPFEEMTRFMKVTCTRYNTTTVLIEGRIKESLLKLAQTHPHLKAVLMGSRNSDPHCTHLQPFQMTDSDWPQYMRVNPILEWSYHDIWQFIRSLYLPYCILYDRAYTSLGGKKVTRRNEKLIERDENGAVVSYKSAYLLEEVSLERKGRL